MSKINFNTLFVGLFTFLSFQISSAMVGGDSSGGGDLLKDTRNPWFLNNTKQVKYCIENDEVHFGLSRERLNELVRKTIHFWKIQLQDVGFSNPFGGGEMRIGQYDFIQFDRCDETIDVRFQFGVLHPEQKSNYLKDPTSVVGTTIRTEYDKVNLKGKGFIYISPQAGPMKMAAPGLRFDTWSFFDGALLFPVLIHEFAHIFGIQHDPGDLIMNAGFPEQAVTGNRDQNDQDNASTWFNIIAKNDYQTIKLYKFNVENSFFANEMCRKSASSASSSSGSTPLENNSVYQLLPSSPFDRFFEVDTAGDKKFCIKNEFRNGKLYVHFGPERTNLKIIGEAVFEVAQYFNSPTLGMPTRLIEIWLPKEQIVYSLGRFQKPEAVMAIGFINKLTTLKGKWINYETKTERLITVYGEAPGYATIGGVLDGQYYFDLRGQF